MEETIISTTSFADTKDNTFDVKFLVSKDGDDIVRITKADKLFLEATLDTTFVETVPKKTEIERLRSFMEITTIPFTKEDLEILNKIISKY